MNKLNIALRFSLLSFIAISILTATYFLSSPQIEKQKLRAKAEKFLEIEANLKISPDFFSKAKKIKIADKEGFLYSSPNSNFIEIYTNKGYSGKILVLIGLNNNKELTGIRILEHKETAGLGDKIEQLSWLSNFKGSSLKNKKFALKKDGGDFDSFSGATISPRAVVNLVNEVLKSINFD